MIFHKPFALLFLFFFLLALPAAASPVDTINARATALAFLERKMPPQGRNKAEKKRQTKRLSTLRLLKSMPAAHIFATPQSDFVIVAADSRLPEILGYGIRHGNAAEKTTTGVAADTAADAMRHAAFPAAMRITRPGKSAPSSARRTASSGSTASIARV